MKKLFPILLVTAAVTIAGCSTASTDTPGTVEQDTQLSSSAQESAPAVANFSASMICDDATHFTAQFDSTMTTATIIVDDVTVATLPMMVSATGKKYGNDAWEYLFKGESVVVTDVATAKTKTCNPPADAENAPMNFGE